MGTLSLLLLIIVPLIAAAAIAVVFVRTGGRRAQARLREVPGPVLRSAGATSLGLTSLGDSQLHGTGTLVLTDAEVCFAQWRPDRLLRIPRAAILEVDTTMTHLGKTMKDDLLRIRWTGAEAGDEDTIAFFVNDVAPWVRDLGGTQSS